MEPNYKTVAIRLPFELYRSIKETGAAKGLRPGTYIRIVLIDWMNEQQESRSKSASEGE